MRKNRLARLVSALLVAATMALVIACGGSGGDSGGEGQTATIGYSGPLSGGAAQYGENALDGIQMAVQDLNEDDDLAQRGPFVQQELFDA